MDGAAAEDVERRREPLAPGRGDVLRGRDGRLEVEHAAGDPAGEEEEHGQRALVRLAGDAAGLLAGEQGERDFRCLAEQPVRVVRDRDDATRAPVALGGLHGLRRRPDAEITTASVPGEGGIGAAAEARSATASTPCA